MAKVGGSWNLWDVLVVGFTSEPAVMFMILLNIVGAAFSYLVSPKGKVQGSIIVYSMTLCMAFVV